jgi:hypothetical protein
MVEKVEDLEEIPSKLKWDAILATLKYLATKLTGREKLQFISDFFSLSSAEMGKKYGKIIESRLTPEETLYWQKRLKEVVE